MTEKDLPVKRNALPLMNLRVASKYSAIFNHFYILKIVNLQFELVFSGFGRLRKDACWKNPTVTSPPFVSTSASGKVGNALYMLPLVDNIHRVQKKKKSIGT